MNSSPAASRSPRQQATRALLRSAGILPVVTVESASQALQIAAALARGGLCAIEVTLRSAAAMDALGAIKRALPEVVLGAGTVTTPRQAQAAVDQGADFLVTPGTPPKLGQALASMALPVIPGAATAGEIMALMDLGFDAVKLFPATSVGGLGMIRSLAGPFPELAICPTGGITEATAAEYLQQSNVPCIGGSWMVAADWIGSGRYELVEASARRARALVDAARAPLAPA